MRCIPRRARQSIDRPRPIDETPVPARVPGERSRCWRYCWTLPELSAFSNRAPSGRSLSLDANDVKEGTREFQGRKGFAHETNAVRLEGRPRHPNGADSSILRLLLCFGGRVCEVSVSVPFPHRPNLYVRLTLA